MSSTASKWLTGCGVGCGAIFLVMFAVGTWGFLFVKSKMQGFAEAETASHELRQKYGRLEDFRPAPDGRIAPERMEVFLKVRENLAPARRTLESSFQDLAEGIDQASDGQESFPQVLDIIGQAFGMVPKLGRFQAERNHELLASGMSPGEYFYVYVLAYYTWLHKSPGDGPRFRIQGQENVNHDGPEEEPDVRQERIATLTRQARRVFLAMLRNQQAGLEGGLAEAPPDPWRKALAREIEALESSPSHLPWQGGLPAAIEASLQPFRTKLEQSYSPLINPLELEMPIAAGRRGHR